jgi:hypothetical protein
MDVNNEKLCDLYGPVRNRELAGNRQGWGGSGIRAEFWRRNLLRNVHTKDQERDGKLSLQLIQFVAI